MKQNTSSEAAKALGAKGGAAGRGTKKKRGSKKYYAELQKKSAAARVQNRAKS